MKNREDKVYCLDKVLGLLTASITWICFNSSDYGIGGLLTNFLLGYLVYYAVAMVYYGNLILKFIKSDT